MYNIITTEDINIENLIYEINGKQVMLDSDLAFLYRCKNGTKEVNQAVKNNPAKFPDRFSWRLSEDETKFFLVKYFDQKRETRGGRFNKPRVFTEQGVAMLATILKTSVATEISIKIMDAFVAMRHYIGNNEFRINNIETKIIEHDNNIKLLQKSFDNLEKNKEINEIYFKGKIYDAYSKVLDIFKTTKKELIIIDRYTDKTVLDMIKELKCKVIIITGSNSRISKLDLLKYNQTYNNLKILINDLFHDRYFIIDWNIIYHSGNSINHIGYRKSSIDLINDINIKNQIFKDIRNIISKDNV